MKGYTDVSVEVAEQAVDNFNKWLKDTETLFHKKVKEYYNQKYNTMNFINKWIYRMHTPIEFLHSQMQCFDVYSGELYVVCTEEETADIRLWCFSVDEDKAAVVQHLILASSTGVLMLDHKLCAFIWKWGDVQ